MGRRIRFRAAAIVWATLAGGLKRDGVPFQFSVLWFSPTDLLATDPKPPAGKDAAGQPGNRERQGDGAA